MEVWTQRVPCKGNVTPEYFARDPLRSYFHAWNLDRTFCLFTYWAFLRDSPVQGNVVFNPFKMTPIRFVGFENSSLHSKKCKQASNYQ